MPLQLQELELRLWSTANALRGPSIRQTSRPTRGLLTAGVAAGEASGPVRLLKRGDAIVRSSTSGFVGACDPGQSGRRIPPRHCVDGNRRLCTWDRSSSA